MKRFFASVVSCLMIGSFLTACASPQMKGAYAKKGKPREAQEQVVSDDAAPQKSNADLLMDLKAMKDKGLISDTDYETKKQQILNRM